METTSGCYKSLSALDEKLTILSKKIKDLEKAAHVLSFLVATGPEESVRRV